MKSIFNCPQLRIKKKEDFGVPIEAAVACMSDDEPDALEDLLAEDFKSVTVWALDYDRPMAITAKGAAANALKRAKFAFREATCDIGVGFEEGICTRRGRYCVVTVAVVYDGEKSYTGPYIVFAVPTAAASKIFARGKIPDEHYRRYGRRAQSPECDGPVRGKQDRFSAVCHALDHVLSIYYESADGVLLQEPEEKGNRT